MLSRATFSTSACSRSTPGPVRDHVREQGGFVLVGVVMFVLALTILGISLFSLSGYEAQFITASYRRTQLLYDAMSGIERTKYVLAASGTLDAASSDLPLPGLESIVSAQAVQNGESTGTVAWSDTSNYIKIRVRAEQPGRPSENVTLEAWYQALDKRTLYRNVIESSRKLFAYYDADEDTNIWINGGIKHNDPVNLQWLGHFRGSHQYGGGGVPDPEVQDFVTYWMPHSQGPPTYSSTAAGQTFRFNLGGAPVKVYDGPYDSLGTHHVPGFGFSDGEEHDIELILDGITNNNQTLIWLLPSGAHFAEAVHTSGFGSNTNLVIVAGVTTCETFLEETGSNLGLWFQGGIESQGIRMFLVSDGAVAIDRTAPNSLSGSQRVGYVTVFSAGVYLRGPQPPTETNAMYLEKSVDDAFLDRLYDGGYLPNTFGRNREFKLVSGSFQESTSSN